MRVLGVRCGKDGIAWVVLEGDDRATAVVTEYEEIKAVPAGTAPHLRPKQLLWVWKEIAEILTRLEVDSVSLKMNEAATGGSARCEVEGVVQAAVQFTGLPLKRYKAVSLRSAFKAANKADLEEKSAAFSAVASSAKSRREQIITALAAFPAQ